MLSRILVALIVVSILVAIDFYVWQGVKTSVRNTSPRSQRVVKYVYWGFSLASILAYLLFMFTTVFVLMDRIWRQMIISFVTVFYLAKLVTVLVLLGEDIYRGIRWVVEWGIALFSGPKAPVAETHVISRSEFLSRSAVALGAIPAGAMLYGILKGAHDYEVLEVEVPLARLPQAFDGLRIVQISDIHSGSFFSRQAVQRGVDMIKGLSPDVVFFTGDIVNNEYWEIYEWLDVFGQIKAPMGVYSIMGNHDYGDYMPQWTAAQKLENRKQIAEAHRQMGWDLLLDQHRYLERNGEKIGILGIENWGTGRFPKYGSVERAIQNYDRNTPVTLLLSHDPSHWDAEVRPRYPWIDLHLAGHTHGMQMGVKLGGKEYSPVSWIYKQWAGLYQEADQYLYVNRGFGYIGYPGRIGMRPEITLMTLKKA